MPKAEDFITSALHYAVVGASANESKYGFKVFRDLCRGGFTVQPVNPKLESLLGCHAAPSLATANPKPEVAVVVVPPEVGLSIVDDARAAGVTKLWFQPGAESEAIRKKAADLKLDVMADGSCIMVERRRLGYTETTHDCQARNKNQTAS